MAYDLIIKFAGFCTAQVFQYTISSGKPDWDNGLSQNWKVLKGPKSQDLWLKAIIRQFGWEVTFDARKSCADQNFEALSGSNPVNSNFAIWYGDITGFGNY